MTKPLPPRMAAEIERVQKVGCRAAPLWIEDVNALVARAEAAEAATEALDSMVHDLLHIVVTLTKNLQIYAPAVGQELREDAEGIFKRWAEVKAAMNPEEGKA